MSFCLSVGHTFGFPICQRRWSPCVKRTPIIFSISEFWPNFRDSAKFQNFGQISKFRPNFRISAKFQKFCQISRVWQNFRILAKFQNYSKVCFCEIYPTCMSSKGASQKKNTGFFGSFSQNSAPPPPHPPYLGGLRPKKI